jgi:hypothetical protein
MFLPAMAAGVTDRLWEVSDIVALLEAIKPKPGKRRAVQEAGGRLMNTKQFDWHCDPIAWTTPVIATYRSTQNVRRFLRSQCGPKFRFDRPFMQWIKDGTAKTMGDVADEWLRRQISD